MVSTFTCIITPFQQDVQKSIPLFPGFVKHGMTEGAGDFFGGGGA